MNVLFIGLIVLVAVFILYFVNKQLTKWTENKEKKWAEKKSPTTDPNVLETFRKSKRKY